MCEKLNNIEHSYSGLMKHISRKITTKFRKLR